jgi:hypothetical protein
LPIADCFLTPHSGKLAIGNWQLAMKLGKRYACGQHPRAGIRLLRFVFDQSSVDCLR